MGWLWAVVVVAAACRHSSGEKGGLVAISASAEQVDRAFEPRRFAAVFGVAAPHDASWRPLKYATKDADDVAAALRDPAVGRFTHVDAHTSPEATTRAALLTSAQALAAEAGRPDDIVVVYVSAHGTLARDHRGALRRYLVTSDTRFDDVAGTALAVDALEAALDAAGSRRRVLVLATCHSGSGKSRFPKDVADELATLKATSFEVPLETASRATVVLSASDWGETAREDDALQNDVYTHFLLEGLPGVADRNADGAVTATEAHDYARRKTWSFSSGRQRPAAELIEVGADPVVLAGAVRRPGQPELYSYAARLDGFSVEVDGKPRGELPGGVAVNAGRHEIELTKGGQPLVHDTIDVGAGERLDLETLVSKAEPSRSVSLVGGAVGFLDGRARSQVLNTAPSLGVAVRFDRLIAQRVALELDVSGFSGPQRLELHGQAPVAFIGSSVVAGVSAWLAWVKGAWAFLAGPRVAGLWVERSFSLDAYRARQSAFSVMPGGAVSVVWQFARRWEASVTAQLMLSVLAIDGQTQVMGVAGGWAAAGYRW